MRNCRALEKLLKTSEPLTDKKVYAWVKLFQRNYMPPRPLSRSNWAGCKQKSNRMIKIIGIFFEPSPSKRLRVLFITCINFCATLQKTTAGTESRLVIHVLVSLSADRKRCDVCGNKQKQSRVTRTRTVTIKNVNKNTLKNIRILSTSISQTPIRTKRNERSRPCSSCYPTHIHRWSFVIIIITFHSCQLAPCCAFCAHTHTH